MATREEPGELLRAGADLLRDIFDAAGMTFSVLTESKGSGGRFAIGRFASKDRHIELHYRYGLGIVRYFYDGHALDHEQFMRAAGHEKDARFPVVNDMTLLGFEALRQDLLDFGAAFLAPDSREFATIAAEARANPKPLGFKGLGK